MGTMTEGQQGTPEDSERQQVTADTPTGAPAYHWQQTSPPPHEGWSLPSDRQHSWMAYQPPEPPPSPPYMSHVPPQPPVKQRHIGRWIILGVIAALVLVGIIAAIAGTSSHPGTDKAAAASRIAEAMGSTGPIQPVTVPTEAQDVVISECTVSTNEFLGPSAILTITNHSSKTSNYIVTVAFESPDGKTQLDTGYASVNNLEPGQSAKTDATSTRDDLRSQDYTCHVANVTRYAS